MLLSAYQSETVLCHGFALLVDVHVVHMNLFLLLKMVFDIQQSHCGHNWTCSYRQQGLIPLEQRL